MVRVFSRYKIPTKETNAHSDSTLRQRESGVRYVPIAIQRNGANRFTVFPKGLLLHPERQLLIDIRKTRVSDLAQEIVQFRRYSKVAVSDFPAKVPQIDE